MKVSVNIMLWYGELGTLVLSLLISSILKEGKISIDNMANWSAIRLTSLTCSVVICLASIILVFASKYLRELLIFACVIFLLCIISPAQGIQVGAEVLRNIYTGTTLDNDPAIQMIYSSIILLWTIFVAWLAVEEAPKEEM